MSFCELGTHCLSRADGWGRLPRGWLLHPDFMAPPLCLGCAPGSDVAETCLSWPAPSMLFTEKKREAEGRSGSRDGNESRPVPSILPTALLLFAGNDRRSTWARVLPGGVRAGSISPRHHPVGPCERLEPSLGLEQQDACSPRSAQVTVLRSQCRCSRKACDHRSQW